MILAIRLLLMITICIYRYTSNPADTVAAGLLGGCNLDCGSFYQLHGQVENATAIL